MTTCGTKAQVFIDGKWSKFMPIHEAEQYEHTQKVHRYLNLLRAGQPIIGLLKDRRAMDEARALYKAERKGATNTLPQAD